MCMDSDIIDSPNFDCIFLAFDVLYFNIKNNIGPIQHTGNKYIQLQKKQDKG